MLTAGGRWVATLGMWSARLGDEGGTIKAALTDGNEFWLGSLTRVDVALGVGRGRWLWRDATIESIEGKRIEMRVTGRKTSG